MNSPTTTSPLNQAGSPSLAKRSITSPGISKQSLGSRPTSPTPKVTIRSAPNSNPNSSNNSPAVSPRRNNDSDDAWRESRGKVIRELVETEQIFHSFTQILINVSLNIIVHINRELSRVVKLDNGITFQLRKSSTIDLKYTHSVIFTYTNEFN
jgi:hypothetical protein